MDPAIRMTPRKRAADDLVATRRVAPRFGVPGCLPRGATVTPVGA
jgi:hypothetical protein